MQRGGCRFEPDRLHLAKKGFVDLLKDIFKPPAGPSPAADRKMDRRHFFRAGLAEMIKPLDAAIRPLEQMAHEVGKLDAIETSYKPPPRNVVDRPWLRPPGSVAEAEFRLLCTKCGECISACPIYAIRIDHGGEDGAGFPYIEADSQACILCEGQPCMPACPTGAMRVTPLDLIDMGTANWFEQGCQRTHGDECTICIDECPIGAAAIELKDGIIEIHEQGCTGCGVCQNRCPTDPKSIIVIPKSSRGPR